MSSPNRRISPSMRASGFRSCIRFKARRKVDLPQPLGPMMAVTARAAMSSETFLTAAFLPKKTDRLRTARASESAGLCPGWTWNGGMVVSGMAFNISSFALEPVAGEEAHTDVDGEHQQEQNEGARPGLPVPVVVRRDGIDVNLQGDGGDGFGQPMGPAEIAGGEQQRRGFTGDARQRQQHAGDNAFERGAQDDLH